MQHHIITLIAIVLPLSAIAQIEIKETAQHAQMQTLNTMQQSADALPISNASNSPTLTPTKASASATKSQMAPAVVTKNVANISSGHQNRGAKLRAPSSTPVNALGNDINGESVDARIDRVVFNRLPILVALKAGQERILSFAHPVTMNVPEDVQHLLQPLDIIGNSIYLTASAPLPRSRVVVQDLVTGQMIPLDLEASNEAVVSRSLDIFTASDARNNTTGKSAASRRRNTSNDGEKDNDVDGSIDSSIDMVMLTRYASHMLYAPRRLITPSTGIRQVKVNIKPVSGLVRGAHLETTPIGAWRSRDLFVTAVKVVNKSKLPFELDLNEVRGQWIAATAQHGMLGTNGSDEDTSAIYLVSERPFEESR